MSQITGWKAGFYLWAYLCMHYIPGVYCASGNGSLYKPDLASAFWA